MKKSLILVLVLLASVLISYGQQKTVKRGQAHVSVPCRKPLLQAKRPAVFLTFLRMQTIKSSDPSADPHNLFFKLTNNTCWSIVLHMSGVEDARWGDAGLFYVIANNETGEAQNGSRYCHVCSFNPMGSGRSLVFSVPFRHADRESSLNIQYEFKWESDEKIGLYESSNTFHTVAYDFSGLPESVLPKTPGN